MTDPNPARFYMVFNPAANSPTYMHGSRESAIAEAKRLAAKHHGQRFFVLEALEAYQVDLPEPRRIELGGNALRPNPSSLDEKISAYPALRMAHAHAIAARKDIAPTFYDGPIPPQTNEQWEKHRVWLEYEASPAGISRRAPKAPPC